MKYEEIIGKLNDIREAIVWNDIKDADLTDKTRESVAIGIDDIIAKLNENED